MTTAPTSKHLTGEIPALNPPLYSPVLEEGGVSELPLAGTVGQVRVEKAASVIGTRGGINFIEGANITLTLGDDAANDEVDVTIAASASGSGATLVTGSYTGDGATSQAISGLGVAPKVVWIAQRATASVAPSTLYIAVSTDTIVDDNAAGAAVELMSGGPDLSINQIISLDADGFTVDDAGSDSHPNKNAQVYNYWAIG